MSRPSKKRKNEESEALSEFRRLNKAVVEDTHRQAWLNTFVGLLMQLEEATPSAWTGHTPDCTLIHEMSVKAKGFASTLAEEASDEQIVVPMLVARFNNIGSTSTKSVANVVAFINNIRSDSKLSPNQAMILDYKKTLAVDNFYHEEDDSDEESGGSSAKAIAHEVAQVLKKPLEDVAKSNNDLAEAINALTEYLKADKTAAEEATPV